MFCPRCKNEIDDSDSYCRFCGAPLQPEKSPVLWFQKGWVIFILAVFVGPFALPLIFSNPHYKKAKKHIYAVLIIIYTGLLLIIPVITLKIVYERFWESIQP